MAFKLGDAVLFFRGDSSKLDQDLEGVKTKTTTAFGGLGGTLNTIIGSAMVTGIGAAVGGLASMGAAAFGVGTDAAKGQDLLRTELGLTEEKAAQLGEVARAVWRDNFGGSIAEAAGAVAEVKKQLSGLGEADLEAATQNAFRFRDAFKKDLPESLDAVNALMEKFGLSQEEAFDFLTKGMQSGLDSSGDFLDTVSEYSNLFAEAGGNAGQFFSLLESGLEGGLLGTDKVADLFKEFQIRFLEGGDEISGALAGLGLDWDSLAGQIAGGQATVTDVFGAVIDKIGQISDPIAQQQAGVALMGGQFEDMGGQAVGALDLAKTSVDELAGATAGLDAQYSGLGTKFEGLKRQALDALAPLGEQLLALVESSMPTLQNFVDWLTGEALPWVMELFAGIQQLFMESGMAEAIEGWRLIATTAVAEITEALGLGGSQFSALEAILWSVEKVFGAMTVAIQLGAVTINAVSKAIVFIVETVKAGIEAFKEFGESLAGLGEKIPDWLKPGSPPPLADALGDIGSQLDALNRRGLPSIMGGDGGQAGAGAAPAAPAAATGGGPQVIQLVVDGEILAEVVNNHLGRSMRQAEMLA